MHRLQIDNNERGSALILSILFIILILLFIIPFLTKISGNYSSAEKSYGSLTAFNLAEAGVEMAIWELNFGNISTWSGDDNERTKSISSFQTSMGDVIGDIEIRIQNPTANTPLIQATGRYPFRGNSTLDKTIHVSLDRHPFNFSFAAFGNDGLILKDSALIDSYDSGLGEYGEEIDNEENIGSHGHVGTNSSTPGSIELKNHTEIFGNATSGLKSVPDSIITDPGSVIYGEKKAFSESHELVSVSTPQGLPPRGSYDLASGGNVFISESGEYSSFILRANSTVTITANVTLYIAGIFEMNSNSYFNIADGVNATIYFGGSFSMASNSAINNSTKDPTLLAILGTDSFTGEMNWPSNTDFWGVVYVPRATINMTTNENFYGSLVANRINMNSTGQIHYDEALKNLEIDVVVEKPYYVKSWKEK